MGGIPAASEPQHPPLTAFDKDGLRVVFAFSRNAAQAGATDITATYTNSGSTTVTDFALQVHSPGKLIGLTLLSLL